LAENHDDFYFPAQQLAEIYTVSNVLAPLSGGKLSPELNFASYCMQYSRFVNRQHIYIRVLGLWLLVTCVCSHPKRSATFHPLAREGTSPQGGIGGCKFGQNMPKQANSHMLGLR
jgi:hypothetical protein